MEESAKLYPIAEEKYKITQNMASDPVSKDRSVFFKNKGKDAEVISCVVLSFYCKNYIEVKVFNE